MVLPPVCREQIFPCIDPIYKKQESPKSILWLWNGQAGIKKNTILTSRNSYNMVHKVAVKAKYNSI